MIRQFFTDGLVWLVAFALLVGYAMAGGWAGWA